MNLTLAAARRYSELSQRCDCKGQKRLWAVADLMRHVEERQAEQAVLLRKAAEQAAKAGSKAIRMIDLNRAWQQLLHATH